MEKETTLRLLIKIPVIRVEVRCPQPPRCSASRSGALVLDLQNILLSPGGSSGDGSTPKARFADLDIAREGPHLLSRRAHSNLFLLDVGRIVVAHSLAGEGKAYLFVSLGPLSPVSISPSTTTPRFGDIGSTLRDQTLSSSVVSVSVNKTASKSRRQRPGTLVITTDAPSVYVNLSKPLLDGLQYWADDISQLAERTFGEKSKGSASERGLSRNSSLLGSHYFAQSSGGSESEFSPKPASEDVSETVVKLSVAEGP